MKTKNKNKAPLFSVKYIVYDFAKLTAALPGLIWYRPKIMPETKDARKMIRKGALIISNHTCIFDPIYLQFAVWYRRHHFICMRELSDSRGGWFFEKFLCIPIDRENFGLDSFHTIIDHLKQDEIVSMFPEGRVNDGSGKMADFKSGMILMALKSGKPIVPIYIKKKEHWYNRVRMAIGESIQIDLASASFKAIDEAAAKLKEKEEYLKQITEGHK